MVTLSLKVFRRFPKMASRLKKVTISLREPPKISSLLYALRAYVFLEEGMV